MGGYYNGDSSENRVIKHERIVIFMSKIEIGCCGAYCKTCKAYIIRACKGCNIGYNTNERDISKAKCAIKVCCIGRGYSTCADCSAFKDCDITNSFYNKNGYKYGKYKQAALFILEHGYEEFIKIADKWKNAYGRLNR